MFTGIVEEVGSVACLERQEDGLRIVVTARTVVEDAHLGDSIAVNGVCLTVVDVGDDSFAADVMEESLKRTNLGELGEGSAVNLERAVAVGQRLGGHIMQGHVDGVGELRSRESSEHWDILRFSLPAELAHYVVEKGSIAVNGTSLTVVDVGDEWFEVSLIPTTLSETTHGQLKVGDRVNIEVDIMGKYIEKMLRD